MTIRFKITEFGPDHDSDAEERALGNWLTWDIGASFVAVLDVLRAIDDIQNGRSRKEVFEVGGQEVSLTAERVTFTMEIGDMVKHSDLPFETVKRASEQYWVFLLENKNDRNPNVAYSFRPELPLAWADLLFWEQAWGPHPYRGRLGIPKSGPE